MFFSGLSPSAGPEGPALHPKSNDHRQVPSRISRVCRGGCDPPQGLKALRYIRNHTITDKSLPAPLASVGQLSPSAGPEGPALHPESNDHRQIASGTSPLSGSCRPPQGLKALRYIRNQTITDKSLPAPHASVGQGLQALPALFRRTLSVPSSPRRLRLSISAEMPNVHGSILSV
jgi:hypothetical protein